MRALIVALAVAMPATAHADVAVFGSIPLELGVTTRADTRFAYSVRPELMIANAGGSTDDGHLAFGPHVELGRSAGDTFVAAGLGGTYYHDKLLTAALDAGVYHRWVDAETETGYAVGTFFGVRIPEAPFDTPCGLRADWRSDGTHHELVLSVQVDLLVGVMAVYGLLNYPTVHN